MDGCTRNKNFKRTMSPRQGRFTTPLNVQRLSIKLLKLDY